MFGEEFGNEFIPKFIQSRIGDKFTESPQLSLSVKLVFETVWKFDI